MSTYHAPNTLAEALELLSAHAPDCTVLAGGTDLVPKLKSGAAAPRALIYIGALGLNYMRQEGSRLAVGAAATWSMLAENPLVSSCAPVLAEAAGIPATSSPGIKNAATVGGNLATASPAADLATPLLALDAEVRIQSVRGARTVALSDFFNGPGKTVLQPDELICEVSIPTCTGNSVFEKIGRRKAMSISVVNTAVRVTLEDGCCRDVRIALGSVAPVPLRCPLAEEMLIGRKPDRELFKACGAAALRASSPIDDAAATAWYRRTAGAALVARALGKAAGLPDTPEK